MYVFKKFFKKILLMQKTQSQDKAKYNKPLHNIVKISFIVARGKKNHRTYLYIRQKID